MALCTGFGFASGFGFGFGVGAAAASVASASSTQAPLTASQTLPFGARPRGRLWWPGSTFARERGARFGVDATATAGDLERARRAAVLALALAAATAVAVGERPRGLGEALLRAGDLLRLVRVAGMGNCGPFARRMFVANNVGIQNGARSACGLQCIEPLC